VQVPAAHTPDRQAPLDVQVAPPTAWQVPDTHVLRPALVESHSALVWHGLPGMTTHLGGLLLESCSQVSVEVCGQLLLEVQETYWHVPDWQL
jgi:hypothetical protein